MSVRIVTTIVCERSLEDPDTGLYSAIGIVEGVEQPITGVFAPGEIFTILHFGPEADGKSFDFRVDYLRTEEASGPMPTTPVFSTKIRTESAVKGRVNVRLKGLYIPPESGSYFIQPVVRVAGEDWTAGSSALVTFGPQNASDDSVRTEAAST